MATEFSRFKRVTSDCKPWPEGGLLALCEECGLVQSPVTTQWQDEADRIYRDYSIYHQSGGKEQCVFAGQDGNGRLRSDAIISNLSRHCSLSPSGRLLDVGCGNGSFLVACSRTLPHWSLCGTEVSDKYKRVIEGISGVEQMFVGDLRDVEGQFDLVSFIHVLEHIPSPQSILATVRAKLADDGLLLIEVPDCLQNRFMLLVADHCSHFSVRALTATVTAAGFEVLLATNQWVSKEVTLLARRSTQDLATCAPQLPSEESDQIFAGVAWLNRVVETASPLANSPGFGIFGTSIAATWLQAQLNEAAQFFVDEDPNRAGREHMGRPIYAPSQVPPASTVFVALPQPLDKAVAERLTRLSIKSVLPPP
jgi:2-polyprenyl-3-methyl-5-hydroxy-6-metoxy-1,4-benzoquinol methylase